MDQTKTTREIPGFNITFTGRHIQITDALKAYALEKMSKIERISDRIIDVVITMDTQKIEHRTDIQMKVGHLLIRGHSVSTDMYASIDQAVDRIQRQMRRYKTKIQDHHAKSLAVVDINVNVVRPHFLDDTNVINDEIEEETQRRLEDEYRPHEIVSNETVPLKTLTYDEAIMKMELSGATFLVFRGETDMKLKVIYRRNDGHFGIIEPE